MDRPITRSNSLDIKKEKIFSPELEHQAEEEFTKNRWDTIQTRNQFIQKEEELLEWIEQVTRRKLYIEATDENLGLLLEDGTILCKLLNGLAPRSILYIPSTPQERVTRFLRKCLDFGVPKELLFNHEDLLSEKKNIVKVLFCLHALAEKCHHLIPFFRGENRKAKREAWQKRTGRLPLSRSPSPSPRKKKRAKTTKTEVIESSEETTSSQNVPMTISQILSDFNSSQETTPLRSYQSENIMRSSSDYEAQPSSPGYEGGRSSTEYDEGNTVIPPPSNEEEEKQQEEQQEEEQEEELIAMEEGSPRGRKRKKSHFAKESLFVPSIEISPASLRKGELNASILLSESLLSPNYVPSSSTPPPSSSSDKKYQSDESLTSSQTKLLSSPNSNKPSSTFSTSSLSSNPQSTTFLSSSSTSSMNQHITPSSSSSSSSLPLTLSPVIPTSANQNSKQVFIESFSKSPNKQENGFQIYLIFMFWILCLWFWGWCFQDFFYSYIS